MPIVIFIIAIVVGSLIHSWLDNYAKEKHADEACAYYISLVKLDKEELNGKLAPFFRHLGSEFKPPFLCTAGV